MTKTRGLRRGGQALFSCRAIAICAFQKDPLSFSEKAYMVVLSLSLTSLHIRIASSRCFSLALFAILLFLRSFALLCHRASIIAIIFQRESEMARKRANSIPFIEGFYILYYSERLLWRRGGV